MIGNWIESFYFNPTVLNPEDKNYLLLDTVKIKNLDVKIMGEINDNPLVIYSHGNKGNLYDRIQIYHEIFYHTGLSVVSYDPPGYGKTRGTCSINNWYQSLREVLNYFSQPIILWGESLGGAINSLVYEEFAHKIIMIIHQESLISIRQTIQFRLPCLACLICPLATEIDVISNYQKLNPEVKLIIVHSRDDQKIPFSQALRLLEAQNHAELIESREQHVCFPIDIRKNVYQKILLFIK